DRFGHTVDRDRIVAGRAPDPNDPNEITIGEGLAAQLGLRPGSSTPVESFSPAQIAAILQGQADVGPRAGPHLTLHVAPIVRRPLDLGDRGAAGGLMVLTPAFDRKYQGRIGVFGERVRVRADRAVDVPKVVAAARRILGPNSFAVQDLTIQTQG